MTVVVPVGPRPRHQAFIDECLGSIRRQTSPADQVLLIDDMANVRGSFLRDANWRIVPPSHVLHELAWPSGISPDRLEIDLWMAPWRLGVPAAFNMGVALASNQLVLMLGADDVLEPKAIAALQETFMARGGVDGFYWFNVRYMDTGEIQGLPCNCAAVTKGYWQHMGGFAPEMAVGACDSMLISQTLVHSPQSLIEVDPGVPHFNYRRHPDTETAAKGAWQGPIFEVRDRLTQEWESPIWGRMMPQGERRARR